MHKSAAMPVLPKKLLMPMRRLSKMIQAVLKSGWDGEWFLRAYDAAGKSRFA